MKFFKKYEYGMWHIHAFESDGSQDSFIPKDLIPISDAEVNQIRSLPPSEEYQKKLEDGIAALGGRSGARYPPKEFKEAIGHICVNSAHLEITIRTVIWQVASLGSEVGMAFTGNMRMGDLLQMLQALVAVRIPSLSQKTKEICSKIVNLQRDRANYVHRTWQPGEKGQPVVSKVFQERSFAKSDEQDVTLDKMYDVAESFMHAESELLLHILQPLIQNADSAL
jgi:hypothetical protein